MTKEIKHSKVKNTGIIFELLMKKITSDFLIGKKESFAQSIFERNFKQNTALGQEYILYKALMETRFDEERKAKEFLDEVISAHKKINKKELDFMKYKLIENIKFNMDIDTFFKPKINNYKLLASIYKVFKSKSLNESVNPKEIVESKFTIIDTLLGKFEKKSKTDIIDEAVQEFNKQSKDVKSLAYALLVDKFNAKYENFNSDQKELLREYINSMTSTNILKGYLSKKIPQIVEKLNKQLPKISDTVVKIKINEVINQINEVLSLKTITENQLLAIMNSYELIKDLENLNG